MIELAADLKRKLVEVPVGFKWFVDGLLDGSMGSAARKAREHRFCGARAVLGAPIKMVPSWACWPAEITAKLGKDPGTRYRELTEKFGDPVYERIDAPANADQKAILSKLSRSRCRLPKLAGDPIEAKLTKAPGNGGSYGRVESGRRRHGWFAARPSAPKDVYKIYAESFVGKDHLRKIQEEARAVISNTFSAAGA